MSLVCHSLIEEGSGSSSKISHTHTLQHTHTQFICGFIVRVLCGSQRLECVNRIVWICTMWWWCSMEWAIKRFFHCQMFVLWTVYIRCSLLMARTLLFHSFSCYLILAYFSSFFFGVRSSSLDAILLRITIGDFYLSNIYYCCFAQASNDANWQYARLAMATGAACDRSTINRLIFASNSFYFIIYDYEIVFRIFINCKRPNNDEWVIAITRSQPLRYCVYLSIRFVRWIKCFCSISVSYSIIYKLRDATQLQYVRVCRAVCQKILE